MSDFLTMQKNANFNTVGYFPHFISFKQCVAKISKPEYDFKIQNNVTMENIEQ